MNTLRKFFLIALVLMAYSAATYAQVTAGATVTSTIVTPIAITNAGNMNFGNMAVSATAGTVILATNGTRTITGGVTLPAVAGTVSAAHFAVSGTGTYTYSISLPTDDTRVSSGQNFMLVNTFISDPSSTGTLSAGGAQTVNVGATIHVGAGQAAGIYTSDSPFQVTVNYN